MPYCKNCGAQVAEDASYCPNCGIAVKGPSKPTLIIAGWGERFGAWIIDMIILGIFLAPIRFIYTLLGLPSLWLPILPFPFSWIPFVEFGFSNIVHFLYWTFMEGTYGQSIGKMAMKLKVTRLNGQPTDMGYAALESFGKAFLLPLDCIVGWLMNSNKNQRLFNILSETVVTKQHL
ncbi:RDD family protein [Candidatus Bathyarchaeota archaeon]|nr:RDD family protein [Candidatus Bathyarchaeota archaeon]